MSAERSLDLKIDDIIAFEVAQDVVGAWVAEVCAWYHPDQEAAPNFINDVRQLVTMRDALSPSNRSVNDLVLNLGSLLAVRNR